MRANYQVATAKIEPVPDLSFRGVPERERTKHVHRLHPYLGKFIPQLVEYFLARYFKPGDTILDPFVGSGTTLVEASVLGMHSIGIEISEFNCLIAKVKTDRYDLSVLEKEIKDILAKVAKFSAQIGRRTLDLFGELTTDSEYLNQWFAPKALQEILYYRSLIPNYQYQDVLKVILSRSTRSCRQIPHYDLARPKKPVKGPYYCYKHGQICQPVDGCLKFLAQYSYDTIKRIRQYAKIRKEVNIKIIHGDARYVELDQQVDGVFTSPPYVGLIDYHDQHRYAYELFKFRDYSDREIGRPALGQDERARETYKQDIVKVFQAINPFIKPDGLVFVVANDKFRLYPQIALESEFEILEVFHRPVTKRTERSTSEFYENVLMMKKANFGS